jgi:hypothetical protein
MMEGLELMEQGDFVLAFYDSLPRVSVGQVVELREKTVTIRPFNAPGEPADELMSFPLSAVAPLEAYVTEQPSGFLQKGTVVLQSANGSLQLAELVHDLKEGETLPLVRLYVGPRNGDLTGLVTATPLKSIIRPEEFLRRRNHAG